MISLRDNTFISEFFFVSNSPFVILKARIDKSLHSLLDEKEVVS